MSETNPARSALWTPARNVIAKALQNKAVDREFVVVRLHELAAAEESPSIAIKALEILLHLSGDGEAVRANPVDELLARYTTTELEAILDDELHQRLLGDSNGDSA